VPAVLPHLSPITRAALKASGDYTSIRAEMSGGIHDAIYDYLTGSGYITIYKALMAAAISQAYIETADIAYQDAGAELPLDPETAAWARAELDAQLGFVDQLFENLRELRKEDDVNATAEALARANGYASGLDGFYNEAVLRGSRNQMVTWHLGATEKHCKTCASLDGHRHKISWLVDNDYIPRKPGAGMECNGYNCDCSITDKDGNEITI
jgi:hypothetical protein